jgi:hypothetical protein
MATRDEVYAAIDSERDYQNKRWQAHDEVEPMTVPKTLTLLQAYIRKAEDAYITEIGHAHAVEILRKIAGIAVAGMEQNGAPIRGDGLVYKRAAV